MTCFFIFYFILFYFFKNTQVLLIKLVLLKSFLEEKNICLMKGRKTTTGSFLDSPNEQVGAVSTERHNDLT